jgi:outer membrane protein insertion porin family
VLNVTVQEQPTGELSFGAGYSTSEGVIGDISITERNLMGKGQYVRLGFSGSLERAQVDFSFTEPHFLDRNLAAGFDLFHKEVDFTNVASYRGARHRRQSQDGIPIAFNTQLGLRYRFEREEIYDVANNASLAVKRPRASPTCRASASRSPTTPAICRSRRPAVSSRPSPRISPASAAT